MATVLGSGIVGGYGSCTSEIAAGGGTAAGGGAAGASGGTAGASGGTATGGGGGGGCVGVGDSLGDVRRGDDGVDNDPAVARSMTLSEA